MPSPSQSTCRICGNDQDNARHPAREMQYGTREVFNYIECSACGCVQIETIPEDLGRFYPNDYFSFRPWRALSRDPVRSFVDPYRVRNSFGEPNLIGQLAEAISSPLSYVEWVKRAGLGRGAAVLDVGCGAGKTLICMALGGFSPCDGIDPFIESDIRYDNGAVVRKASLAEFAVSAPRTYDLITFHHSLEHVVDPLADLRLAAGLLSPGGCIMLGLPVAAYAWTHYRGDWCNLDAPRHLHLLTDKSMAILAQGAGLRIRDQVCCSNPGQFYGSERNRRDIASVENRKPETLFTAAEVAEFKRRTAQLNAEGQGDLKTYWLERAAG
jgi:SAM-dependent methyltransferase